MGKKIVLLMAICIAVLVVILFGFLMLKIPVHVPTAKIASVTKDEWWYSTFHGFHFTVQVKNNGTETVNGTTVMIRLYHDWMNVFWPVVNYTNEVEEYKFGGNILRFGAIPAGDNETQSLDFTVDDLSKDMPVGGWTVPTDYAVATIFLGNSTLDKQTLQFNYTQGLQQTWVFP